jgi:hypothetical protein
MMANRLSDVTRLCVLLVFVNLSTTFAHPKPCHLLDTIPFRDGDYQEDKVTHTIQHNNLSYTKELWGYFESEIIDGVEVKADKHKRGCFCDVIKCIRVCCPLEFIYLPEKGCIKSQETVDGQLDIVVNRGSPPINLKTVGSYKDRAIYGNPCKDMYDDFGFERVFHFNLVSYFVNGFIYLPNLEVWCNCRMFMLI